MSGGTHFHPAHPDDRVKRVCLNCPHGRCTEEEKGCAAYQAAVREVTKESPKHKWMRKERTHEPIPADIAEKLGIEPKEDV